MSVEGKQLFWVGLGGAAGAIGRALLSHVPGLPPEIAILTVNISGCALIGLVLHIEHRFHPHVRDFQAAGFCGGLTTVSSWSLILVKYLEMGELRQAGFFAGLSLVSGILALLLGRAVAAGIEGLLLRRETPE
jgi:CrcB protein